MRNNTTEQKLFSILSRHNVPNGLQAAIIRDLTANYRLTVRRRRTPCNRYFRGIELVYERKGCWKAGDMEAPSLSALKWLIALSQAKKNKRNLVIKRPCLAPFFVKVSSTNIAVFEDRGTYQKTISSGCSDLGHAAKVVSQQLFKRGVVIGQGAVLGELERPAKN